MDANELVRARIRHEMSMNFLWNLFNERKLTQKEFERAAKFVDEKYDIENLDIKLGILRSENSQADPSKTRNGVTHLPAANKKKYEAEIKYISLTDIAKQFSNAEPSYVVQSWMRSRNTLEFLNLWEKRHNNNFNADGYENLLAKLKTGAFTMTPKQWIAQTKAIGIASKSGKNGGTYAHPLLACEFMMWLSPEYKINILELWEHTN